MARKGFFSFHNYIIFISQLDYGYHTHVYTGCWKNHGHKNVFHKNSNLNLTNLNCKTPEFFLLGLGYSIYK